MYGLINKRMDAWEEKERKAREDAEMDHGRQAPQKKRAEDRQSLGKVSDDEKDEDPDESELLKTKGEENERGEARHVVADSQTFRDMKAAKMAQCASQIRSSCFALFHVARLVRLDGETIRAYRVRLLQPYKANSDEYKGVGR